SVVMMTAVAPQNVAVGIDNASGDELWRVDGRVLHTTEDAVFLAVDQQVVAIDIRTGDQRWAVDVPVERDGVSPAGRLGVVRNGVLVTVSGGGIVGLDVGSGEAVWDPIPLVDAGVDLGAPLVVAVAGGRAVVA